MNFVSQVKNIFLREVILRYKIIKLILTYFSKKRIGINLKFQKVLENDTTFQKKLSNLYQSGVVLFDEKISEPIVEKILDELKDKQCVDSYHPHVGSFNLSNPPEDVHVGEYLMPNLLHISEIIKIANKPEILAIVQAYLGCKPTISNLTVWHSFITNKQGQYAQLYHRDYDDIRFVKLFVFLSDVDEQSGAHVYIKNTVDSNKFRRPKRYSDLLIEQSFSSEKIILCGKRGTFFLEDTFGIHKGNVPINKPRQILQVQYSMHGLLSEIYNPQTLPVEIENLDLDPYINRMLYKFSQ